MSKKVISEELCLLIIKSCILLLLLLIKENDEMHKLYILHALHSKKKKYFKNKKYILIFQLTLSLFFILCKLCVLYLIVLYNA